MSEQGVFAAVVLGLIVLAGVAAAVVYDVVRYLRGGQDATETFGVRWLARHVPLTTHAAMFALGLLIGGLAVHFFASPGFYWP